MSARSAEESEMFRIARELLPGTVSHSKVWAIVDHFRQSRGRDGGDYKRITYADPTGERATFRVWITSLTR